MLTFFFPSGSHLFFYFILGIIFQRKDCEFYADKLSCFFCVCGFEDLYHSLVGFSHFGNNINNKAMFSSSIFVLFLTFKYFVYLTLFWYKVLGKNQLCFFFS